MKNNDQASTQQKKLEEHGVERAIASLIQNLIQASYKIKVSNQTKVNYPKNWVKQKLDAKTTLFNWVVILGNPNSYQIKYLL